MDTKKQTNDFLSQADKGVFFFFFGMLVTQTSTIWCMSMREFR